MTLDVITEFLENTVIRIVRAIVIRPGLSRRSSLSIFVATSALAALLLCQLPGEPAPVAEKPTQSQLQTQFDQAEAVLGATAEKTKERADAAKKAMKIASDIAWLAFDAGKYEEAANWFAKSAELKAESHVNARAYWEEYRRTVVAQTEAGLAARIKEFQTQLATAEESKKGALRIFHRRAGKDPIHDELHRDFHAGNRRQRKRRHRGSGRIR